MKSLVLYFFVVFCITPVVMASSASSTPGSTAYAVTGPLNCVNPGGSCNGSVPCCDSYNNACFRNRCQRVSGPGLEWLQQATLESRSAVQTSQALEKLSE